MTVLKWFLSFEPPVKKIIVFRGAVQESNLEQTITIPDTLLLSEKDPATIILKATFSPQEISRSRRRFTSDTITFMGEIPLEHSIRFCTDFETITRREKRSSIPWPEYVARLSFPRILIDN